VTIIDNWFVSGMRGTGSKDFEIHDAFVPAHRAVDSALIQEGASDGWAIHRRSSYRAPRFSLMTGTLLAPIVGMARGAVEAYGEQLSGRRARDGGAMSSSVAAQMRLAESSVEADTARLLLGTNTREVLDRAARGDTFSLLDRARYRRDQMFMARLALRSVARIIEAAGGHALHDSHPLQRFHRDIVAASQHHALRWDENIEQYGRLALGLEPLPHVRI
jgi:3-hydroxy-9,10-secoandrosta-1,3,5(10)-triene-9,17-dione monooxygenase